MSGLMDENRKWLKEFEQKHGRKPKILHIGNIANNAYNNAKLLNEAGLDCDVLCYDYYHIMGCPEWEDADFEGDWEDDFFPQWRKVNLKGYQRPKWFVQGPFNICVKYLIAKNENKVLEKRLYWFLLKYFFYGKSVFYTNILRVGSSIKKNILRVGKSIKKNILKDFPLLFLLSILLFFVAVKTCKEFLYSSASSVIACSMIALLIHIVLRRKTAPINDPFEDRLQELCDAFVQMFPERGNFLTKEDMLPYKKKYTLLKKIFSYYDLVEAYATDPIFPMLVKGTKYVAYEHGTIRDIPFEDSLIGQMTALSYKLANKTIITNPDCYAAAKRLGLNDYRYIPHVIDSKYYSKNKKSRANQIFCPARHDWAVKGTDIIIKAFLEFSKKYPDTSLLMTEWGNDIQKSKDLINDLGLSDKVHFIKPQPIQGLIKCCKESMIVIDQFKGYFGGLAPAALATGTPLIMNLEYSTCSWCFNGLPPFFQAKAPDELLTALMQAVDSELISYKERSAKWMNENYHYTDVIYKHMKIYNELISSSG